MYFKNNTGDENFDFWRSALSDSIITDLSQSKFIRVLSAADLSSILRRQNLLEAKFYTSEDLKKVAVEGRVNHILQGGLSKAGDTFRIDYTLHEMGTGEAISSDRVEGTGEESIFTMVDDLTKKIKIGLELSEEQIASDLDKEFGKITTGSPEAYKYYSEGRKYYNQGDSRQSIGLMEKAVAVDSEFAMAYRSMAMSYRNMGYRTEWTKYIKKALELTDRISDRERYHIQGDFYHNESENTYDKAIEAFSKLLELYPEHSVGNNNLAILFRSIEEWDKALERYEVVIQAKEESVWVYQGTARIYMAKGLYEKAREVLEYFLNNFSDNAVIHSRLASVYRSQGKYDLALVELDKAFFLNPNYDGLIRGKGAIYQYKGDLIESEKEYLKLLEATEQSAQYSGRLGLTNLYFLQGKFERAKDQIKQSITIAEKMGNMAAKSSRHNHLGFLHSESGNPEMALEECEKAWNIAVKAELIPQQRTALHLKGLVFLKIGSIDEAQRTAVELKELVDKGMNRKAIRYYYHLMGMIELDRENFSKAIEYFEEASSLLPFQRLQSDAHAIFFDPLAFAYYKSGDLEKAQEEYEKIISLTIGRFFYGYIYAKSFYMLGNIFEQKGWKGKAIEHYEKFLELWKDTDYGIAEVEDARKRLAGLKSLP
jgi:tetratricopeptide (TPR) repeat protein